MCMTLNILFNITLSNEQFQYVLVQQTHTTHRGYVLEKSHK